MNTYVVDKEKLKLLREQKLYIPEYVLNFNHPFTGEVNYQLNQNEIFRASKINYVVLTNEDINKRIIEGKTEFYYLNYVFSGNQYYLTVVNSKTGVPIYSRNGYSTTSSLKIKYITELEKAIWQDR